MAAPAFRGIALNSLAYLKILPAGDAKKTPNQLKAKPEPPEADKVQQEAMSEGDAFDEQADGTSVMPDFRGMSMRRVLQVMEKRNLNIRLLGSGRAMEQSPPPGQAIKGTGEVWIKFAPAA